LSVIIIILNNVIFVYRKVPECIERLKFGQRGLVLVILKPGKKGSILRPSEKEIPERCPVTKMPVSLKY
jgi:hypothetical protein